MLLWRDFSAAVAFASSPGQDSLHVQAELK
jgi:hypothetical protein